MPPRSMVFTVSRIPVHATLLPMGDAWTSPPSSRSVASSASHSIFDTGSKLLKNVKLFDIFESESLGKGKKSLAFQLEFYDESRTLTEEEINKEFWDSIEKVKKEFDAQLRG